LYRQNVDNPSTPYLKHREAHQPLHYAASKQDQHGRKGKMGVKSKPVVADPDAIREKRRADCRQARRQATNAELMFSLKHNRSMYRKSRPFGEFNPNVMGIQI
jgi:hypothetical protein